MRPPSSLSVHGTRAQHPRLVYDLFHSLGAVDMRLTGAYEVKVRTVDYQYSFHWSGIYAPKLTILAHTAKSRGDYFRGDYFRVCYLETVP